MIEASCYSTRLTGIVGFKNAGQTHGLPISSHQHVAGIVTTRKQLYFVSTHLICLFCPNCDKKWYHGQTSIQCTSCEGWVHHNRLNCSGLTDTEFDCHMNTSSEPFSCDKCLAESNAKAFVWLPFVDFDDVNHVPKKSDIKSMNPGELKDFIAQCDSIQNIVDFDDDDFDEMSTQVNSKLMS